MTKKLLFKHTISLLRTAMLIGVIAFVSTPQATAQPVSLTKDMPDAFETKTPTIGDGQYYFIQFYEEVTYSPYLFQSFVGEFGEGNKMRACDYLPFAPNRQWRLVAGSDANHFKLQSKRGNFVYWNGTNFVSSSTQATEFSLNSRGSHRTGYTYYELRVSENVNMGREKGNLSNYEWADLVAVGNGNVHGFVRFATLKPTAAHIIYYREEHNDGYDNSQYRANNLTTRHYLTYSGTDAATSVGLINNGGMEGEDASSFFAGTPGSNGPQTATITAGVGNNNSRGVVITSSGTFDNNNNPISWDTQFFIRSEEVIPVGTTFHIEFDYRADGAVSIGTQAHAEPGSYIDYQMLGNLSFSATWQHFAADITVTTEMGNGRENNKNNSFQTIAFNLWTGSPHTYYFDNIILTAPRTPEVSSRRSIIPSDKSLWTLPTAAVYHQDGLWDLEETGVVDGEFYIKKHNEEKYLTVRQIDTYNYCTVLGDKDVDFGKFNLEDPTVSRYTRIHNNAAAWGIPRYLTHTDNDGGSVLQAPYDRTDYWYAGFYPVEVPESKKDEFFQVRLVLNDESKQPIYLDNGMTEGMTRSLLPGVSSTNITGAKYTPTDNYQRCFQYNNLAIPQGYNKIVVRFAAPVVGNWNISGIVNGNQSWEAIPEGSKWYEMDLTGHSSIDDLTIFNWEGERNSISIAEVYFYKGSMIDENGCSVTSSESDPILWQLEQENDYRKFRLKNENGAYLNGVCSTTSDPNNSNAIYSNLRLIGDFSLRWYLPKKDAVKEIVVNQYVRHKESYLRAYADDQVITDQTGLKKQGLATDIDSDWWNFDGNGFEDSYSKKGTQKTNHFEITHYLKKGDSKVIEFPTVLNKNNDHIQYQRFYNYDELDTSMDLDKLKAHVNLDIHNDGEVQYFLYKNGIVTGEKLDWTGIEVGELVRKEQRRFNFTNSDGQRFTVGVDVSRYSDLQYLDNGDLREPSLTMRYLFNMRDAKEMAADLTACTYGSNKWLEEKTIHFGRTQVPYTKFKKVGYRGEFIGLRHLFSDYWVFDGNGTGDANLISAVNDDDSGKIEVEIFDPHNTGIRKGGYNPNIDLNSEGTSEGNDADYQGFYLYDLLSPSPKHEYGNSRFVVFRYPEGGIVHNCGPNNQAYVRVYLNAGNNKRYQLAQFTLIFDANMATRPWTEIKNGTTYANGVNLVKGTNRDPHVLREKAGNPIAKITFDYPTGTTYHYPSNGVTKHNGGDNNSGGTIANSSPVPLTFGNTNYAFDGDGCNWGSYAIVTYKKTTWGNNKDVYPADHDKHGYNLPADDGMQKAFLYIDASEQPGDICAVDFQGDFCAGDLLMCTGWISGSNRIQGDTRCPGSITLTVKGQDVGGEVKTIYRFCPGQIYELDNGYQEGTAQGAAGVDGNGNGADCVVWQQFFFEFSTAHKYDHYWLEVNNNCVSSNGGDFMLDNVEVYAVVPEVEPEINTPLCVTLKEDGTTETEMRLLKLNIEYDKLMNSANVNSANVSSGTAKIGFVFLEKEKFLKKLRALKNLESTYPTLDAFAEAIEKDLYLLNDNDPDYKTAFDEALLGDKKIWDSTAPSTNMGGGVMYFQWNTNFEAMESYTFAKAVNKKGAVFRYEDDDFVKWLILNGNYPELPWKTETEYYIVPTNEEITNFEHDVYRTFNICSQCSKASVFKIEPPYHVLGLESSETTNDYMVCEGQIPTILLDLKGFTLDGREVDLNDLNFDWWLGNATTLATLENYHKQNNGNGIKLDKALSTFRTYYTEATSLDGLRHEVQHTPDPALTVEMIDYLQELVDAGELVLHQKSVSVPAEKASNEDPYFYLVACPIHDGYFDKALNPKKNEYVTYFCDEPQGLRIKVGQKAPMLKCGFVPGERGFSTYDYTFPAGTDPVLSIRLARVAQFETVKNTVAEGTTASASVNHLWLPIRNAETESAGRVIKKSQDDNIYLASTNDPTWDQNIYTAMSEGSLPVVGRIVELNAINTKGGINLSSQNTNNLLRIYFTKNFEVREGYNYTLSLPFQEDQNANSCDGTILINLKIVPDYEVWTGAAGNTDWNNDENWRRADGNTEDHSGLNDDELYVSAATSTSPLSGYKTNKWNYRTAKDRVFRKGFAPLYCTHVLMKSDEWGNAPVLYDAIDGKPLNNLTNSRLVNLPFPNLRETSTPILKFDMQARKYNMWYETYGTNPDRGNDSRPNDLIAEMYQINSCDEIAMQPGTELQDAHLLNYNTAWVEYQIDNKRWYLLGSPLQGTISGEWYAPKSTAQQKTTYYDPVSFGTGYDRYNPAIYQRSWDKAKAVLYEIGSSYATTDDSQTGNLGTGNEGKWSNNTSTAEWQVEGGGTADEYLDRLGYKPMGGNKANVAIQGIWSNTYNDATVDYANGGFSVMVMNHLKGTANDQSNDITIVRLPKEDTMYKYWSFNQDVNGTNTPLDDVRTDLNRAKNRGRLKTDLLLPTSTNKTEKADSRYGDKRTYTRIPIKEGDLNTMLTGIRNHEETISAGVSNLGYYLVENPFPCGLNMDKFFAGNKKLLPKYWILTATGKQHLVQKVDDEWISSTSDGFATADGVAVPGQGFFVEADPSFTDSDIAYTDGVGQTTTITFTKDMQAQSRYGVQSGTGKTYTIVVGTKQKMKTVQETITMDDGTTQTATVEVPVTDASGNYVLEDLTEDVVVYNYDQTTETDKQYKLKTRGETAEAILPGLVITAEREDFESSALVMQRGTASNDFLPEEDTETFITSDLQHVPTVYTLCGRLATTINSIHDFRSLSLGVESNSDAPCTLTFKGVEMLGDSIAFYDAVEKTLTPLESGMQVSVSGQTQNRYYLVRGLNLKEAAEETHLQIFTEGLTAKVIASTAEPILVVRCFDTSGRLLYTANPDSAEHSFTLPGKGIYIIEAQTENDRKTKKVMTK